jgi:hypothetical protein
MVFKELKGIQVILEQPGLLEHKEIKVFRG